MRKHLIEASVKVEQWPLKEPFVLARGSRTHAEVVYLQITDGTFLGHSECQPNARYNERSEDVISQLTDCFPATVEKLEVLSRTLPSYAARNALDCALWDYKVKAGVLQLANLPPRECAGGIPSYFTLSVGSPDKMANAARAVYTDGCRRLKLKFAGAGDDERLLAVRSAAPTASIIIDANEAWTEKHLRQFLPLLEQANVDLLEQPLPAGADSCLEDVKTPIILCADESCHTSADVSGLVGKYDAVNIKLDKTGGLTSALKLLQTAQAADFKIMVGCMLGTSLSVAPAFHLATQAHFVDLDAPLLLEVDRKNGFVVNSSFVFESTKISWWG